MAGTPDHGGAVEDHVPFDVLVDCLFADTGAADVKSEDNNPGAAVAAPLSPSLRRLICFPASPPEPSPEANVGGSSRNSGAPAKPKVNVAAALAAIVAGDVGATPGAFLVCALGAKLI